MADEIDKLDGLPQTVEVQQARGGRRWPEIRRGSVVGPIYGNGRVETVRMANDQVRIGTRTNTDDLNPLATQRMAGMGDRYPSQGRWG